MSLIFGTCTFTIIRTNCQIWLNNQSVEFCKKCFDESEENHLDHSTHVETLLTYSEVMLLPSAVAGFDSFKGCRVRYY